MLSKRWEEKWVAARHWTAPSLVPDPAVVKPGWPPAIPSRVRHLAPNGLRLLTENLDLSLKVVIVTPPSLFPLNY